MLEKATRLAKVWYCAGDCVMSLLCSAPDENPEPTEIIKSNLMTYVI